MDSRCPLEFRLHSKRYAESGRFWTRLFILNTPNNESACENSLCTHRSDCILASARYNRALTTIITHGGCISHIVMTDLRIFALGDSLCRVYCDASVWIQTRQTNPEMWISLHSIKMFLPLHLCCHMRES